MDPPDPRLGMTLAQAYRIVFDENNLSPGAKAFGARLVHAGGIEERWIYVKEFPRQGGVWMSRGDFGIGEHGGGWAYSEHNF